MFGFHQIKNKECLEYSAKSETNQTYRKKKTLRLEVLCCCGTDTSTNPAQYCGNSVTVTDMCVCLITHNLIGTITGT